MRVALSNMAPNTGSNSPADPLMILRTSDVAENCSNASSRSRVRRELRFLAHRLWRTAPLWRHRFVALRFNSFGACSGAPSHRPPQGSGQGIVVGQISTQEVAGGRSPNFR